MLQEDRDFFIALLKSFPKVLPKLFSEEKKDESDETFRKYVNDWIMDRWRSLVKTPTQRHLCDFIETIPQFQEYFPVPDYNDFFIGELASLIKTGSKEVKKLASISYCELYLKNYLSATRSGTLGKILSLSKSTTCFERLAALGFVEVAMTYFSRRFLAEEGIVKAYLSLGEDKIANVRIKFVVLSPKMNKLIVQEELRSQLMMVLTLHQNDMDKDVRKLAKDAYQSIKQQGIVNEDDSMKEKREQDLIKKEKEVLCMNC